MPSQTSPSDIGSFCPIRRNKTELGVLLSASLRDRHSAHRYHPMIIARACHHSPPIGRSHYVRNPTRRYLVQGRKTRTLAFCQEEVVEQRTTNKLGASGRQSRRIELHQEPKVITTYNAPVKLSMLRVEGHIDEPVITIIILVPWDGLLHLDALMTPTANARVLSLF